MDSIFLLLLLGSLVTALCCFFSWQIGYERGILDAAEILRNKR